MIPEKKQPLLKYISKYIALTKEEEGILLSKTTYRKYLKNQYIVHKEEHNTSNFSPRLSRLPCYECN